jgi:photosystem II stability/assembly factor-like uncharacterized protein
VAGRFWVGFEAAGYDGPGIFKTADAGQSWHPFVSGMRAVGLKDLLTSEEEPVLLGQTFGGRLLRSENGGDTWQRSGDAIGDGIFRDVIGDPISPGVFYGGTDSGVYRSLDSGESWTKWGDPSASPTNADSVSVSSLTPRDLYAAKQGGVYFSHDGGETWQFSSKDPFPVYRGRRVIAAPSSADIVYQLISTFFHNAEDVLLRSADGGATWVVASESTFRALRVLMVDSSDPNRLYGASSFLPSASLILITEGGKTRSEMPVGEASGYVTEFIQDGAAPSHFVVGTSHGEIWESSDARDSWVKLAERLGEPVTALALDPFSSRRIYVGTENGVFVVPLP